MHHIFNVEIVLVDEIESARILLCSMENSNAMFRNKENLSNLFNTWTSFISIEKTLEFNN